MMETVQVPKEPPEALLRSMGMRYRHDFGLDAMDNDGPISVGLTDRERESIMRVMRQLYEEATGQGFYKFPDNHD
jgi:hypothetical protein